MYLCAGAKGAQRDKPGLGRATADDDPVFGIDDDTGLAQLAGDTLTELRNSWTARVVVTAMFRHRLCDARADHGGRFSLGFSRAGAAV